MRFFSGTYWEIYAFEAPHRTFFRTRWAWPCWRFRGSVCWQFSQRRWNHQMNPFPSLACQAGSNLEKEMEEASGRRSNGQSMTLSCERVCCSTWDHQANSGTEMLCSLEQMECSWRSPEGDHQKCRGILKSSNTKLGWNMPSCSALLEALSSTQNVTWNHKRC